MNKALEKFDDNKQPTRLDQALHLHQQVMLGFIAQADGIKKIRDEKFYLDLGCESFKEYIDSMSPISRTQAYISIKAIERFTSVGLLSKSNNESQSLNTLLLNINKSKLVEIIKLDDPDLKDLLDGEGLDLGENKLMLNELARMKTNEVKQQLVDFRRKHSSKTAKLEEANKKLESEGKAKDEDIKGLKKDLQDFKDLEQRFGRRAWKLSDRRRKIEIARASLHTANCMIVSLNLKEDDPDEFKEQVMDFIKHIDMIHKNLMNRHSGLVS